MKSILYIGYLTCLLTLLGCSNLSSDKQLSPRINHVMLYVSDLDHSTAFYTRAFELQLTNKLDTLIVVQADGMEVIRNVNMAFLKFPGQDFVLELAQQVADTSRLVTYSFQHVGIDVLDIEAAYQRTMDAGAKALAPVRKVKAKGIEARQAFVAGPDGERIELMQIISGEF